MKEYAIEVRDLCIDYLPYKQKNIQHNIFKRNKEKLEMIHAVKNVSFSLEKGKILGIIGRNGSGKSTMLRAIAGIFQPDKGYIDLHSNSISLLSIGVGFDNELTGRENIVLSGMLLGFSEKQIEDNMDSIIEFSELGKFVDYPVRTYSSGMYSKLAFSITASLETDIILIDEVLSVGDAHFRKKSSNKMKELINDNERTVVIVSHSADTISSLCDDVLWIDAGNLVKYGDAKTIIKEYQDYMTM